LEWSLADTWCPATADARLNGSLVALALEQEVLRRGCELHVVGVDLAVPVVRLVVQRLVEPPSAFLRHEGALSLVVGPR
jgi:hypothetical protein